MKTFDNKSFKSSAKSSPIKASRLNTTQDLSPVKSQLYKSYNSDKKQIITKVLYLFTFYSSKISKYSYRQLNEKVFILLIGDLYHVKNHKQLQRNSVEQKQYLNVYYSMRSKKTGAGIKFEEFLQCLPVISVYMCPQIEQRQQAVKQLMQYLIALYETRIACLIENHVVDYEQPINDQTKEMIIKMMPSFSTVYKKLYFQHEFTGKFNTTDHLHESFQSLMKMMKDFEIFPKLISASQLYFLYHTTLNVEQNNLLHETQFSKQKIHQEGLLFTLSKMIELLIACSRICYGRLKNLQNPEYDIANQKQIFKTFLEYMEAIKATKNSAKNLQLFKEHRFSFILLEEYQHEFQKNSMTKTFVVKDKIIKQTEKQMEFFGLFDKLQL